MTKIQFNLSAKIAVKDMSNFIVTPYNMDNEKDSTYSVKIYLNDQLLKTQYTNQDYDLKLGYRAQGTYALKVVFEGDDSYDPAEFTAQIINNTPTGEAQYHWSDDSTKKYAWNDISFTAYKAGMNNSDIERIELTYSYNNIKNIDFNHEIAIDTNYNGKSISWSAIDVYDSNTYQLLAKFPDENVWLYKHLDIGSDFIYFNVDTSVVSDKPDVAYPFMIYPSGEPWESLYVDSPTTPSVSMIGGVFDFTNTNDILDKKIYGWRKDFTSGSDDEFYLKNQYDEYLQCNGQKAKVKVEVNRIVDVNTNLTYSYLKGKGFGFHNTTGTVTFRRFSTEPFIPFASPKDQRIPCTPCKTKVNIYTLNNNNLRLDYFTLTKVNDHLTVAERSFDFYNLPTDNPNMSQVYNDNGNSTLYIRQKAYDNGRKYVWVNAGEVVKKITELQDGDVVNFYEPNTDSDTPMQMGSGYLDDHINAIAMADDTLPHFDKTQTISPIVYDNLKKRPIDGWIVEKNTDSTFCLYRDNHKTGNKNYMLLDSDGNFYLGYETDVNLGLATKCVFGAYTNSSNELVAEMDGYKGVIYVEDPYCPHFELARYDGKFAVMRKLNKLEDNYNFNPVLTVINLSRGGGLFLPGDQLSIHINSITSAGIHLSNTLYIDGEKVGTSSMDYTIPQDKHGVMTIKYVCESTDLYLSDSDTITINVDDVRLQFSDKSNIPYLGGKDSKITLPFVKTDNITDITTVTDASYAKSEISGSTVVVTALEEFTSSSDLAREFNVSLQGQYSGNTISDSVTVPQKKYTDPELDFTIDGVLYEGNTGIINVTTNSKGTLSYYLNGKQIDSNNFTMPLGESTIGVKVGKSSVEAYYEKYVEKTITVGKKPQANLSLEVTGSFTVDGFLTITPITDVDAPITILYDNVKIGTVKQGESVTYQNKKSGKYTIQAFIYTTDNLIGKTVYKNITIGKKTTRGTIKCIGSHKAGSVHAISVDSLDLAYMKNIKVYVNDILIGVLATGYRMLNWTPSVKGNYTIKAVLADSTNEYLNPLTISTDVTIIDRDIIILNVSADGATKVGDKVIITVDTLSDGIVIVSDGYEVIGGCSNGYTIEYIPKHSGEITLNAHVNQTENWPYASTTYPITIKDIPTPEKPKGSGTSEGATDATSTILSSVSGTIKEGWGVLPNYYIQKSINTFNGNYSVEVTWLVDGHNHTILKTDNIEVSCKDFVYTIKCYDNVVNAQFDTDTTQTVTLYISSVDGYSYISTSTGMYQKKELSATCPQTETIKIYGSTLKNTIKEVKVSNTQVQVDDNNLLAYNYTFRTVGDVFCLYDSVHDEYTSTTMDGASLNDSVEMQNTNQQTTVTLRKAKAAVQSTDDSGNIYRQEEHMLYRLVKQYETPSTILEMTVFDNGITSIKPYSKIYEKYLSDKIFIIDEMHFDYQANTVKLKVVEKK